MKADAHKETRGEYSAIDATKDPVAAGILAGLESFHCAELITAGNGGYTSRNLDLYDYTPSGDGKEIVVVYQLRLMIKSPGKSYAKKVMRYWQAAFTPGSNAVSNAKILKVRGQYLHWLIQHGYSPIAGLQGKKEMQ